VNAGKSTIARRIAAQHGLDVYSTDDVMPGHAGRSTPVDAPNLSRFKAMDMDERWVNRSPGFRLLPHRVKPLLAQPGHAVWLLPTPEFRRAAFDSRGTTWDIPRKTGDPERARHNLLERDRMFTDRLVEETKLLGLPSIGIDTMISEDELARQVTRAFGL